MTPLTTIIERSTNRIGTYHGEGTGILRGRLRVKEHGSGKWFFPWPHEVFVPMLQNSVRNKRRRLAGLIGHLAGGGLR
jgi:hypothetical protein